MCVRDDLLHLHQGAVNSMGVCTVPFVLTSVSSDCGTELGPDNQYYLVH